MPDPVEQPTSEPELTPQQKLVAEYELPDDSFNPEIDSESASLPASEAAQETSSPAPPTGTPARGPDGRFVKPEDAPRHSERMVEMARDYNVAPEEIERMTPAEREIVLHDRHKQFVQSYNAERASKQAPVAPTNPPTAEDALDFGNDDRGKKIDEGDIHEGVVRVLKQMQAKIKRLESLEPVVRELGQHSAPCPQRNAPLSVLTRHSTPSGTKRRSARGAPSVGPKLLTRRNAVLGIAYQLTGKQKPTLEDAAPFIEKAIKTLYPSSARVPADQPGSSEIDEWNNGAVQRPTQRQERPAPKGKQNAATKVAQFMKEHPEILHTNGTEADELPE